ncbi:phosphotransferase [Rhodococcus sp. FH8]|uniref:phosphotransferase n=1 Tax=Rhodococcus TaxID=1827 RepID=UPI001C4F2656|nr:phosphotransferase [Rhodococcus sp. FH8]
MSNPLAVLVDDDKQQLVEVSSTIVDAGYELITFESLEEALNFLDSADALIDLFVLDRKLPMRIGEKAVDELGDELFRTVTVSHPDARVIVFSGFTDFDHAQESMEGTGFVFDDGAVRINRVSVVRKSQFDKFERFIRELRELITRFEMIEFSVDGALEDHQKRVLRRIAYHYGASSISARPLSGGLSDAAVWRCEVASPSGPIAAVVAKVSESVPAAGGLQDLLPRDCIARRVEVIRGLMGGSIVSILQLAGTSTASLMSLIASNDLEAARVVQSLRIGLDALERSQARSIPLRELVEQILHWDVFARELLAIGLSTPSPDLWVTTSTVMSHTDLHAANVLVCDGSPVLIDSDENKFSSALRDPAVLLMSSWVHPDSPFRSDWPTVQGISEHFGEPSFAQGSLSPAWCASVLAWMKERRASTREYWAVVLAYGARQLRFENVRSSEDLTAKVVALVVLAHTRLLD